MTPDEIAYVRAWAASGNEPREPNVCSPCPDYVRPTPSGDMVLSETGLLIARLADALEQANETAEWLVLDGESPSGPGAKTMETLRKNRAELLGDA